jgi:hypothetical protein
VKHAVSVWLAAVMLLALSACIAPVSQTDEIFEATRTATVMPSPTETIVWFPPTPTRTPVPTTEVIATPDLRPQRGSELLVDDFSDGGHWQVGQSPDGSIAYGRSELTLAVRQPRAALTSLRDGPPLNDFYLEMTTRANLCRGADMYGLLVRAASVDDYYRFLINCNGELRVERITDGRSLPIQDWVPSGIIPAGSPVELRIAISASGRVMRLFINDIHQFDVSDPVISGGTVGVYARSTGESALTVSFSDLVVTALLPNGEIMSLESTPEPPDDACPLDTYTGRPRCEDK